MKIDVTQTKNDETLVDVQYGYTSQPSKFNNFDDALAFATQVFIAIRLKGTSIYMEVFRLPKQEE